MTGLRLSGQTPIRERVPGYVNSALLQSTLREMQRHFTDPRVLGSMAVIGAILGFSGPFGTFQYLDTVPRVIYWLATVVVTYGVGFLVGNLTTTALRRRFASPAPRIIFMGLLIGPPVTLAVFAINIATFGLGGFQPIDSLTLFLNCTLIAMGVSAISEIIEASIRKGAPGTAPASAPAILERLPVQLRGPLVSLSVQDHYVEVATAKGKSLVLMRLGDAIREVGETRGIQVHRSHWVALDAVARVNRAGGKVTVELSNGTSVPVSRGYMPAAKDAGLVV